MPTEWYLYWGRVSHLLAINSHSVSDGEFGLSELIFVTSFTFNSIYWIFFDEQMKWFSYKKNNFCPDLHLYILSSVRNWWVCFRDIGCLRFDYIMCFECFFFILGSCPTSGIFLWITFYASVFRYKIEYWMRLEFFGFFFLCCFS